MSTLDTLRERVVLVTGATGGLGRAVALGAAALGAVVVLHGRNEERLVEVYDEIVALGGAEPAAIPLDFSGAGTRHYDAMAADLAQNLGRLDGIAHCAFQASTLKQVDATSAEEWEALLRVNFVAAVGLTRSCLPLLRGAPDASVVYTLESHYAEPAAYWSAFGVPNAALHAAMRCQAEEWRTTASIRFNAVVPGPIATKSRSLTHPAEARSTLRAPSDVAPTYLGLLGPEGTGTTGQVIRAQP